MVADDQVITLNSPNGFNIGLTEKFSKYGNSALMLVCARLRHVAGAQWGNKKYMNMRHLVAALDDAPLAG